MRGGLFMTIPIKMVGSEEGRPSEGDATQCGACLKRQSEVNYGVVLSTRRGGRVVLRFSPGSTDLQH